MDNTQNENGANDNSQGEENFFQVDLAGLVEVLSRNLYSGPRVFVRELLQNGVDAITARRQLDPDCPNTIRFVTDGKKLKITDSGVGLSFEQAKTLLATIGASSKRDDLGFSRTDYLGQFGIGLLSCFMVSETITVFSKSAAVPDSPVIRWVGKSDGTWAVDYPNPVEIPADLSGSGTTIVLEQIPGERFFDYQVLASLISEYGKYLPIKTTLAATTESGQIIAAPEVLTGETGPWDLPEMERAKWCSENFGFVPFDIIEFNIPIAGITGVGFVLAQGATLGQQLRHQVYLRSMLLGKQITDLLPEWAYFVKVVLNTEHLKPTASREQLFDDEVLEAARQQMGGQIRQWLQNLATENPGRFTAFTNLHVIGLKALSVTDRQTRDLVANTVMFKTSQGLMSLDEVIEKSGTIRYVASDDEFRTIEPIARANEMYLVNAGFAFDEDLLAQLALDRPQLNIAKLDPIEVLSVMSQPGLSQEASLLPLMDAAQTALAEQNLNLELRCFDPVSIPVLFLPDGDLAGRIIEQEALSGDDLFADLMGQASQSRGTDITESGPKLIFNAKATIVNELVSALAKPELVMSAIRGLYVQALLSGHHFMNHQARSWASTVFTSLISYSLNDKKN